MVRQRIMPWIVVVSALVVLVVAMVVAPRLMSPGLEGIVTAVDPTGMATIKTEDDREYQIMGTGWRVGDKVVCKTQGGKVRCEKS